jgi:hypothetical protein
MDLGGGEVGSVHPEANVADEIQIANAAAAAPAQCEYG